jgi:hypothetical protein
LCYSGGYIYGGFWLLTDQQFMNMFVTELAVFALADSITIANST